MKIEKLNDHQIRCTLNHADLAERELKISELAYGTEKAKELFREMMQQASYEFGFEAEDIPLMIEAIPVSSDCIILVITKVEDPDELDTRFSKFAPSQDDDDESDTEPDDDIASLFSKIQELRDSVNLDDEDLQRIEDIDDTKASAADFVPFKESLKTESKKAMATTKPAEDAKDSVQRLVRIFSFTSFDKANVACVSAYNSAKHDGMDMKSALYKDEANNLYYMVINLATSKRELAEEFNRMCNSISEFGARVQASYSSESYYKEHFETIIKANALSVLSSL